jgi:hypothetical protein
VPRTARRMVLGVRCVCCMGVPSCPTGAGAGPVARRTGTFVLSTSPTPTTLCG